MKKLTYVFIAFFMAAFFIGVKFQEKEKRPNVIFICPDQYRNYSLGFWSENDNEKYIQGKPDPVSTPALDKLASQGIVFSNAISNFPLCSPYRGMLLSGMYPDKNGITNNCRKDREASLKTDLTVITDVFSQSGYNVAYFGKAHWLKNDPVFDRDGNFVGSTESPGGHYINRYDTYVPPGPDRHGIDYFFQAIKDDHFNPMVYSSDPKAVDGKKDGELYLPGKFSAELESEKIIDYLNNTHEQRDSDKPFFMIWSLNPPHNPWTEESTYMKFYAQYTENGKANIDSLLTHENADTIVGAYAPYYFANVSAVDHFIGNVLTALEELSLDDNTIIVFTSDHGEMLGSHGQRGKNVAEIESLNIPFVIKWGDKLSHRVEDLILSVPDVFPTLLGLAGLENEIPAAVQGENYGQILQDKDSDKASRPKSALFLNQNSRGVFTKKYTFVITENAGVVKEIFCYDNEVDPYQMEKISMEHLDNQTAAYLKNELAYLLKNTGDKWFQNKTAAEVLPY